MPGSRLLGSGPRQCYFVFCSGRRHRTTCHGNSMKFLEAVGSGSDCKIQVAQRMTDSPAEVCASGTFCNYRTALSAQLPVQCLTARQSLLQIVWVPESGCSLSSDVYLRRQVPINIIPGIAWVHSTIAFSAPYLPPAWAYVILQSSSKIWLLQFTALKSSVVP